MCKVHRQHEIDAFVLRIVMSLLLAVSFAGCAPLSPRFSESVLLAPGVQLDLPPLAAFGRQAEMMQWVVARHGEDVFIFEGRLSIGPDRLLLVAIDPFGRRAITIDWNGAQMNVERAPWLPETLPPENMLADIVLLFWPEDAIRHALHGAELAVGNASRSIRRGSEEIIAITYDNHPDTIVATLTNRSRHYEIEVRSKTLTP